MRGAVRQPVWAAVVAIGAILGAVQLARIAELDANGISLIANKPPSWDFTNLWYAGRLAGAGQLDTLFDVERYREGLRALFAPTIDDSEWSYPPTMLLFGVVLGQLPLALAHALWTLATLALLLFVMRRAGLSRAGCALLCLSPGVLNNIAFGQNGALTAALLFGGLVAAEARPARAGLAFGLLTVKPQFGLLVPVALAAGRHWRAIAWSAAAAGALVALSLLAFGLEAWRGFAGVTQPLVRTILEAPWGEGYHANATTIFMGARRLGVGVGPAYAVQAAASLAAAAIVWRLWREPTRDALLRATTTGLLALLATPYSFSYDLVLLACAVLAIRRAAGARYDLLLAPLWLWPLVVNVVNVEIGPLSPLVLAGAVAVALHAGRAHRRDHPVASTMSHSNAAAAPGSARATSRSR